MNSPLAGLRTCHRRSLAPVLVVAAGLLTGSLAPAASADHPGRAAQLAPPSGGPMRIGPNFPLMAGRSPLYGRDAVGLAVNPRDEKHIVAVYVDYKTLWCEVASSFDGGQRWRRTRLRSPAGFISPPCTVGPHLANFLDGSIAFGRGRTVYTTIASSTLDERGESRGQSVLVARSTNGGRSFGTGVVALRGGDDPDVGPDYTLPKLAVDPGRRGVRDRIHLVAAANEQAAGQPSQANIAYTVSHDGGQSWAPRQDADAPGQDAIEPTEPALGPGGAVHVAWRTRLPGRPPARFSPEGTIYAARSTDLGRTWTRTPVAGVRGFVYTGPPQPLYATTQAFTGSSFPRLAADRRSGNVYIAYNNGGVPLPQGQAQAADHFIHNDADVWFQRSTNGGSAWSDPVRLNRSAPAQLEVTQTRHPNLSVAPNGRLDVVWQDRRHWYLGPPKRDGRGTCTHTHTECDEGRLGDTYYRSSSDGGASFSAERRITDRSMNNDVGYDYRFGTYWDYGPKAVPIGNDRILFAWMDSRDGNVETDNMGIYLAEAHLRGPREIPVRRLPHRSAAGLAVRMSQLAYPGGSEAVLAATFATRPFSRVVIVNERDVGGALAAGVLARAFLGPVLISPAGGLPAAVRDEVQRLAPLGAYLVGGTGSLSDQVAADLAETGIPREEIVRVAGADPASTAAAIATELDRRNPEQRAAGMPAFDAAVIVNPASRDAVAVSALAANRRLPVLFTGSDAAPAATLAALQALNVPRTLVIGDSEVVADSVLAQLPQPRRLGGGDPTATSRAVLSQSRLRGVPTNVVFATPPTPRMNAAVMGATVGRIGAQLLLTSGGAEGAREILGARGLRSAVDHLVVLERPRPRRR